MQIFNGMNLDMTKETLLKMNLELRPPTPDEIISHQDDPEKEGPAESSLQCAQLVEGGELQGAVCWDRERILYWELEPVSSRLQATWLNVQQNSSIVDFSFYTKVGTWNKV